VLANIPLDERLRIGSDIGTPIVASHPDSPQPRSCCGSRSSCPGRSRGLAGLQLGLTPAGRL
jgi:ATP-binding protein involved in chromosome partitioning